MYTENCKAAGAMIERGMTFLLIEKELFGKRKVAYKEINKKCL